MGWWKICSRLLVGCAESCSRITTGTGSIRARLIFFFLLFSAAVALYFFAGLIFVLRFREKQGQNNEAVYTMTEQFTVGFIVILILSPLN